MPVEIERKFLVDGDAWRTGVRKRELFRQATPRFDSHPASCPRRSGPAAPRHLR
jgi:CYTH domain-containing protein